MTSTPNRAPALEPHKPAIPSLALVHAALDDRTLLALLLRRTDPDDDPERLAAALLDRFGSLGGVAGATPGELARASSAGPPSRPTSSCCASSRSAWRAKTPAAVR